MSDKAFHRVYYALKPWLPKRLRYGLRGIDAKRKIKKFADSWPILPGSETPPPDWRGWPEGREFAVILTHDVEGRKGLDRCRQLMDLEARNGFRSSFNFVPEGEYHVDDSFREEVESRGFEVGVHDLHHDGSLFRSRGEFTSQSKRINEYLQKWGAVGFRAGFMFHNLEWMKELEVLYDASTFDTDPFEPQPSGVSTIFPFWVARENGEGFVELPYTLVQDSTLFLILRQGDNSIWKRKADWVADRGGMILLNVHPDYLDFHTGVPERGTFAVSHYEGFLQYIQQQYRGRFWSPLPKELASWFKGQHASQVSVDRSSLNRQSGSASVVST